MKKIVICCTCAAGIAAFQVDASLAAASGDAESQDQARIAFADMGGIRDWQAAGNEALYVEARNGQWYRAELFGRCSGLPFAHTIGFAFEPSGAFDRFSSIVVDGRECRLKSLVKSAPPENQRSKSERQAAQQAAADEERTAAASDAAKSATAQSGETSSDQGGDEPADESGSKDARIPFAHLGGIENWRATDEDTLYIEGRNDQWYRAELFGFCPGLQFETSIGFVTRPAGGFDEFSSIVVDGRECRLKSLTESAPPPAG